MEGTKKGSAIEKYQVLNNLLMFGQQQLEGLQNAVKQDPKNIGFLSQISMLEHDVEQLRPVCQKYYDGIMFEIEQETGMEPLKHPAIKRKSDGD